MPIDITLALEIPGWMEESELRWLADMAAAAQTIVEVGAWRGRSTYALADNTPGVVYTVDNWCDAREESDQRNGELAAHGAGQIEADWTRNIADFLDTGKVTLRRGNSPDMAAPLQLLTGGVDFVFIDADHSLAGCLADIRAYRPIVRPGGILAGHDYSTPAHPGVKEAVDLCFGNDAVHGPGSIWWVVIR